MSPQIHFLLSEVLRGTLSLQDVYHEDYLLAHELLNFYSMNLHLRQELQYEQLLIEEYIRKTILLIHNDPVRVLQFVI